MSEQVHYSTRWLQGFGVTDGEEMERLWAFLRRFSVITKEMTPSHRIDLLSDGLLHYRQRKVSDIGRICDEAFFFLSLSLLEAFLGYLNWMDGNGAAPAQYICIIKKIKLHCTNQSYVRHI